MQNVKEKVSVIIPVYNEEQTIARNIEKIKENLDAISDNREFEIIVVDDGSTDDTLQAVEWMQYSLAEIEWTLFNNGKGAAFLKGCEKVTGDYVVLMDSDMQIDIHDLESFFRISLLYNAPVVIGNKRHHYSYTHYSLVRRIISRGYNFMCRMMFGFNLRDTQCGMKLFKRSALDKIKDKLMVKRFAFDLELIVAFRENDIRIATAPVRVEKQKGSGSVNIRNIIDTARDTLAVWLRKMRGWYRC